MRNLGQAPPRSRFSPGFVGLWGLAFAVLCGGTVAAEERPVDFDAEVVPLMTRLGCNAGACHGAAAGRGGLRLSLLGGHPEEDHERLVVELEGRRVNLARPADSLLLAKPSEQLPHEGGQRFAWEGPEYELLRRWIAQGARRRPSPKVDRLTLKPDELRLSAPGLAPAVQAFAHFHPDDEPTNVTAQAQWWSPDEQALTVVGPGQVQLLRPGVHNVLVRYRGHVSAVRVTAPIGDQPLKQRSVEPLPAEHWIDQEIAALLELLRLPPAPACDDAAFLRRVSLDLTGRLPTLQRLQQFTTDPDPNKRTKLVDELLASPAFVDYWTARWCEWLGVRSGAMQPAGVEAVGSWLRKQIADNAGVDEMVHALLTASGDRSHVGPANFAVAKADPRSLAEHTATLFLGARLQCANCHDHPLDRWTQDDYHGLAAVFAPLERGPVVRFTGRGEVTHPRTGEPAAPRLPGVDFLPAAGDSRPALAAWITSHDRNPLFAQAMVNRVWNALFGRGLVEPIDDLRPTNPASHPRLLLRLSSDFAASGHDLRRLLRELISTAAYQRSTTPIHPHADDRYLSVSLRRPLPPAVLLDALNDVLGTPSPALFSTLLDSDHPSPELDLLGRCPPRSVTCPTASPSVSPGLSRQLQLLNGPLLNSRLASPTGRLHTSLSTSPPPSTLLSDFFLRSLSRPPTPSESSSLLPDLTTHAAWEDCLWSLLTSPEFVKHR